MPDEPTMEAGDGTKYEPAEPYKDPGAETGDGTKIEPRSADEEPVMTTGTGDVLSGPDAGSNTGSTEEMTKAELYEKAKEADIPGRSEMTKEELAAALEEEESK